MTPIATLQATVANLVSYAREAASQSAWFDSDAALEQLCIDLEAAWPILDATAQAQLGDLLGTFEHASVRDDLPDMTCALSSLQAAALRLSV